MSGPETSIPSLLTLPVFVVAQRAKKCGACGRPTTYFDGCSIVECPQRKPLTAAVCDKPKGEER